MACRLFRGGVPTDPEVKALMALGAAPGDEVTYERVEQIIGAGRRDRRFDVSDDLLPIEYRSIGI